MEVAFSMEPALEMVKAMVQIELLCACTRWAILLGSYRSECIIRKLRMSGALPN